MNTFSADQKNAITKVVDELNGKGYPKVQKYFSIPAVGIGCGTHPGTDQQAMMAAQLRTAIRPVMGW